MKPKIRLQKYIARCTPYSRRKAEELIGEGLVTVNKIVIETQGVTIDPSKDIVKLNGKTLTFNEETIYLILHKPAGYLSTKADTHERNTIMDLIPHKNLNPVGRLDKDTEGLLLLTNDGDFAYKITHPKFEHEKEYIVHLKNPLSDSDKKKIEKGIVLDGSKTAPCVISKIQHTKCHIIIHEGKKRQIKRMFEEIQNRVVYLKRIRIGKLLLGTLKKGAYKIISKEAANKALKK